MDVMLDKDGEIQHPIDLNLIIVVIHIICCCAGIPLNAFIAIVILRLKRLNRKPRNIFLFGIIFSNLLSFVTVIIEIVYFFHPSDLMCRIYVAAIGPSYVIFFYNLLLAVLDRYVAISHPLQHRKCVTTRNVIICQIIGSVLLTIIVKLVYIADILPLLCVIHLLDGEVTGVVIVLFFSGSIVMQIIVYRLTKKLLLGNRAVGEVKTSSTTNSMVRIVSSLFDSAAVNQNMARANSTPNDNIELAELNTDKEEERSKHRKESSTMKVHHGNPAILTEMEIEATKTLFLGVLSLCIFTLPLILYAGVVFVCHWIFGEAPCAFMSWLTPYFKELVVIHAVYQPRYHSSSINTTTQ